MAVKAEARRGESWLHDRLGQPTNLRIIAQAKLATRSFGQ
jgi:hypothetical protein